MNEVTEVLLFREGIVDVFRLVNIVLSVVAIVLMLVVWPRTARRLTRSQVLLRLSIGVSTAAVLLASVETFIADRTAPGIRTYLLTLALVWTVASIVFEIVDDRAARERRERLERGIRRIEREVFDNQVEEGHDE